MKILGYKVSANEKFVKVPLSITKSSVKNLTDKAFPGRKIFPRVVRLAQCVRLVFNYKGLSSDV